MGCGNSKGINAFSTQTRPASAPTSANQQLSIDQKQKPSSAASRKSDQPRAQSGKISIAAIQAEDAALRGGSAASDRSIDSGIGNESRDGSANLARITLPPPGPRYAQQLPPELSILKPADRPRPRVDEESILASLRQEGLLGAPNTSTKKGGLSFEVPAEELKVRSRRPPPRLQRLEKDHLGNVTTDDIRQKLNSAEARRKKRENEKVQRNREKDAKNLEVKLASLDADVSEISELKPADRLISAKFRRRPPSGTVLSTQPQPPSEELQIMTPKASPLIIDDIPVGASGQKFF